MEAGLRTCDLDSPYPEEFNRQAVGVLAKYNFAPTEQAKQNLLRYDRMALPRGDPQKNGNTRIMHKSKRIHFSKLPNVRAFCFQIAKFIMCPTLVNIIEASNDRCDF